MTCVGYSRAQLRTLSSLLNSSGHSIQTRHGLPTMFFRVFCGIRYAFLFWISSSWTIAIILWSAEVFSGSVCPSLISSSDSISCTSSWREFCRSDSWSFHIWQIIQPIRKIGYNNSCEKQFCVRKSCLSLFMITRKHGPTYWIIEHADKMVKTTEQREPKENKANSIKDATKRFSKPCQKLTIL